MKVTAALCWFDEDPAMLAECVASLEGFADRLVAVDGPYELWEHTFTESSEDEYAAIEDAAKTAGLEVDFTKRCGEWPRQIEKRSFAISEAAKGSDWVFPLDTDWEISGDPPLFRTELAIATKADAGVVSFVTPAPRNSDWFHPWHLETANTVRPYPLVYRALPEIGVERAHWGYMATKDGVRVSLWDGPEPAAAQFQITGMIITHRCFDRDERKVYENKRYCQRREGLSTVLEEA